jgi:hypothetical protein
MHAGAVALRCVTSGRRGLAVTIDAAPSRDGLIVLVHEQHWVGEFRRPYRAVALREAGEELFRPHRCLSNHGRLR